MNRTFVIVALLLLAGCQDGSVTEIAAPTSPPDGACKMRGNDPARHYCATTFLQVLANPERYDGRLIYLQGWVGKGEESVIMFPSQDSAAGIEMQAALHIRSGDALSDVRAHIGRYSVGGTPVRVSVGGRFTLNRSASPMAGTGSGLFGALDDVDIYDY